MFCSCIVLLLGSAGATFSQAISAPERLRVEGLLSHEALLSEAKPRFSFSHAAVESNSYGVTQASYRITVAVRTASGAAGSTLYWDSGDVASAAANEIEYSGPRLKPFTRYLWTAEWTPSAASGATAHSNHTTARSAAASATFETGPMRDADWGNALWLPGSHRQNLGLLRKDFTLPASAAGTTVAWARAYVASPGCAVLQVNGVVPSSPDYRGVCPWVVSGAALLRNTRYMVHDITAQVTAAGKNTVGMIAGQVMDSSQSIIGLVMVQLSDGSKPYFVSTGEQGWMVGPSYYTVATAWKSMIDWTKEEAGWSTPGFTPSSDWMAVAPTKTQTMPARALMMPFTTVLNEVKPVVVEKLSDGAFLYTFPKNFVGTIRVKAVEGAVAGSVLTVLTGEWLSTTSPAPAPPAPPGPKPPPPTPPGPPATCKSNIPENADAKIGGCPAGQKIASVDFASFGTPEGSCAKGGLKINPKCHANSSKSVVEKACVGAKSCVVPATVDTFQVDPCLGTKKSLSIKVTCSSSSAGYAAGKGGVSAAAALAQHNRVSIVSTTTSTDPLPPLPPRPDNGTYPTISSRTQYEVHTLRAGNAADLETAFCWHGFQYVRVTPSNGTTGFTGALDAIVGLEMHTNMSSTGSITFGDAAAVTAATTAAATTAAGDDSAADVLNGIFSMTLQSQRTNVAAYIPTDCPTREKHGWMGDALDASEQAMYNFDTRAVHAAFLQTIQDNQGSGGDVPVVIPAGIPGPGSCQDIAWTSAYPQLHDMLHTYYGDKRVAERAWPSLVLYQENLVANAAKNPQHIAECDQFKDWLCGEAQSCCSGTPANSSCPVGPEMGAFNYVLGLRAMADMATFLGNTSSAARYASIASTATAGFHAAFYNSELHAYGGDLGAVQSLTTPALQINAMPAALKQPVVDYLEHDLADVTDFQPFVGAVTSKILLNVLSDNNLHATALKTATSTAQPSWGYWWSQNSSTCWESWPIGHGTRNHIFLCGGAVEWMWKHVVGLVPTAPQFQKVAVAPKVHPVYGSRSARASYASASGTIGSSWKIASGGTAVTLNVSLPVGVLEGTVVVPTPFTKTPTLPHQKCLASTEQESPMVLGCDEASGEVITSIDFAALGTPTPPAAGGACSGWKVNATCNADQQMVEKVVRSLCVGKSACEIAVGIGRKDSPFGPTDPCFDVVKTLAVVATCSGGDAYVQSPTAVVREGGVVIWDGAKLVGPTHPGVVSASAVANGVAFEVKNGAFAFASSQVTTTTTAM